MKKTASNPKTMNTQEIDNIREDLKSLKDNVLVLSKKVEAEGKLTAAELKEKARENMTELKAKAQTKISDLQNYSAEQLKSVEKEIRNKPAQSVAIAFGAGLLASFLLSRRG